MFRHRRSTRRVLSALAWLFLPACGDTGWEESSATVEAEACVGAPARMGRRSLSVARPLDAAEQVLTLDARGGSVDELEVRGARGRQRGRRLATRP
ncbi:hypothetical protein D7X32_09305 [Corallococcus carmarthensis]|uniref:Uncharacterized protein n=1 Tax=Corallococcus carmarthensis TaxID=2316728 RepID=A0A3A8K9V7_9BACT|nr:hypothetical protein D7X32_09305 [Corallococcus carmarthensis]